MYRLWLPFARPMPARQPWRSGRPSGSRPSLLGEQFTAIEVRASHNRIELWKAMKPRPCRVARHRTRRGRRGWTALVKCPLHGWRRCGDATSIAAHFVPYGQGRRQTVRRPGTTRKSTTAQLPQSSSSAPTRHAHRQPHRASRRLWDTPKEFIPRFITQTTPRMGGNRFDGYH